MSQSLQSWLLNTLNADAAGALEMRTELADMPYITGNRVQIIKFLTFRPAENPKKPIDVWALVGDRTHMMPARFVATQVSRYQTLHPNVVFTTLRGAVVMLRQFRSTVSRVPAVVTGVPWREAEWLPALEVCGFEVLGSIGEATFFPRVKLITREVGSDLVKWLNKWAKKKEERAIKRKRLAQETSANVHVPKSTPPNAEPDNSVDLVLSGGQTFPTPAQRVPPRQEQQREPQTSTPVKDIEPSLPTSTNETKSSSPPIKHAETKLKSKSPWDDFDLDEDLPPSNLLPFLSYSVQEFLQPDDPPPPLEVEEEEQVRAVRRSPNIPEPDPDPDPNESGLSDYERKERQKKRRLVAKRRKMDAQKKLESLMASIVD